MTKKIDQLSIIIPILNEGKNIKQLLFKILKNIKITKYEIIFVDDNSEDNTTKVFREIKKNNNRINLIVRKSKQRDLSKSCVLGFKVSKYKNIMVMDGDLQHDPSYISKFLSTASKEQCDVVVGCRDLINQKKIEINFFRKLISQLLILLVNVFLGKKTRDPMSGFFLFKKKIFLKVKNKIYNKGYKILADIIYSNKTKLKIIDIKINFKQRKYGYSKINYKILMYLLIFIIKKFFNK